MNPDNPKISTCCTCGYAWPTGSVGSHHCSVHMAKTIADLKLTQKHTYRRILAARNVLAHHDDIEEAYQHLYAIASPMFTKTDPWAAMEAEVGYTTPEALNTELELEQTG